jgi:putative N-acetylmannosamine-6-phosphate epimerase
MRLSVPLVGCHKIDVKNPEMEPYLTNTLDRVQKVAKWCQIVSIDYRKCNAINLREISDWCRNNNVKVVADIGDMADYRFIKEHGFHYTWIATTFSVFRVHNFPDVRFARQLARAGEKVIAEGNFVSRAQILETIKDGIGNVCIGGAISNVYKLTRRYVSVYGQTNIRR